VIAGLLLLVSGGCVSTEAADYRPPAWWQPVESVAASPVIAPRPIAAAAGWHKGTFNGGTAILERTALESDGSVCRTADGDLALALEQRTVRDFDAGARIRNEAGPQESGGLAVRWLDPENYYLARLSSDHNSVRFYRYSGGKVTLLASRSLPLAVRRWHRLTVQARGYEYVLGLDGEPLLTATDSTLKEGGLALWAERGASVCFDDVTLKPID
jgi:hypothetical protein